MSVGWSVDCLWDTIEFPSNSNQIRVWCFLYMCMWCSQININSTNQNSSVPKIDKNQAKQKRKNHLSLMKQKVVLISSKTEIFFPETLPIYIHTPMWFDFFLFFFVFASNQKKKIKKNKSKTTTTTTMNEWMGPEDIHWRKQKYKTSGPNEC